LQGLARGDRNATAAKSRNNHYEALELRDGLDRLGNVDAVSRE